MRVYIEIVKKDLEKIGKSNSSTRNSVFGHISYLEGAGTEVRRPKADKVEKDIWELRPKKYRILYTYINNEAYLLVVFKKSGNKIPTKELELARKRLESLK